MTTSTVACTQPSSVGRRTSSPPLAPLKSHYSVFQCCYICTAFRPISLCVYSVVFISVYFVFLFHHHHPRISSRLKSWNKTSEPLHVCCIIVSTVGWTGWDWSLILRTLPSFRALKVGWVIWPVKTRPDMTYSVTVDWLLLTRWRSVVRHVTMRARATRRVVSWCQGSVLWARYIVLLFE